jgi:hypothetical protein
MSLPYLLANHLCHHMTFGYVEKTNISGVEATPSSNEPQSFSGRIASGLIETFGWRQNNEREYVQLRAHLEKTAVSFGNLDEKLTLLRYTIVCSFLVVVGFRVYRFLLKRRAPVIFRHPKSRRRRHAIKAIMAS